MGPSGSGKTTLLFALSGMDGITGGSVKFGDTELSGLREKCACGSSPDPDGVYFFQQPTMLRNLNLLDNIMLPAVQDGKRNIAELAQKKRDT
ncbi:ATP-binding cassette domain-containing protein [Paenibacillus rhizoplanae]